MELQGAWSIPVGGKWPIEFKWKGDDLPSGVTIASATRTVVPATGLTVDAPVLNSDSTGVIFWVTAVMAGSYSILIDALRSDGGHNIALGHVTVTPASDRTSLNANALVTLADLLGFLGEENPISKNTAEAIINSVSQEFDRYLGQVIKQATYTNLYIDGNGREDLRLPGWPAAEVTGVYEDDDLLTEGLDYDYVLYSSDGDAYLRRIDDLWLVGPKTVKITSVKLGFAVVPGDIQLARLKQCAVEFQRAKQKSWDETSRSIGEQSVSLVDPGLLPDVVAVLNRYRRYHL